MTRTLKALWNGFQRVKLGLLVYVLFDIFIAPGPSGLFDLTPMAAAQSSCDTVNRLHVDSGVFNSLAYTTWRFQVFSAPSASGAGTLVLRQPAVKLCDGYNVQPLSTNVPITVGVGSNAETVTPSAVSGCSINGPQNTCSVTATFSNVHGPGEFVTSGDQGIQEAINDAASQANGGINLVYWVIDPGSVTLSTGGATTSAGSINIPARSLVMAASGRVTTTIGTCAGGWSLGITGGSGTDFTAANTTLTAGTTTDSSTLAAGLPVKTTAAALPTIFCTTSNASAGAVHPRYSGYKVVAPSF